MGSADDIAYRKSVRNMSVILAVMVVIVFVALFIPPLVNPPHNLYARTAASDTPYGFTLHLQISTTSAQAGGVVGIVGWLNGTSGPIANITSSDSWALGPNGLWQKVCTPGWPIGVGVMKGHYTEDNFTLGTLVPTPPTEVLCPSQQATPAYFLLEGRTSTAFVDLAGTPKFWTLESSYSFSYTTQPGVYTAVLADEWGDVLTTNFIVASSA